VKIGPIARDMNRYLRHLTPWKRHAGAARASSFETRVVSLSLIATVSALILTFGVFSFIDWQGDRADLAGAQKILALDLADDARNALDGGAPETAAKVKAMIDASGDAQAVAYVASDGRRMEFVHAHASASGLRAEGGSAPTSRFVGGSVIVHIPDVVDGVRIGELVLSASENALIVKLRRNLLMVSGLCVFALGVAALIAKMMARRALRPLHRLDDSIEAVRRTRDFGQVVTVVSNDEFGRLTRNFNGLLEELKTNDDSLRSAIEAVSDARDAAEKANVMKSQFLANMSHEIRTPLNGVLGMARAMALHRLDRAQRERLDVIHASGASLMAVLDDLLDLAKIEAGRFELETVAFDIGQIAGEACDTFAAVADAKALAFTLEVADEARGAWRGDPTRVRQILNNLISNALKFTGTGSVRVSVALEPGGEAPGSEVLRLVVADSGPGMGPEVLASLFQKFSQGDNSNTRRFGGTGLGLAISRQLAQLMGGDISVESTVGQGSEFVVTLPLERSSEAVAQGAAPDAVDPTQLSQLKVLAAEDNPTNQLVLRTILQAMGVQVTIVADGRHAVDACAAGRFDLVLMDIQMPVMDGLDATREIRRLERERGAARTLVVALSANAMTHQVKEYLDADMDDHLAKPIEIERLHAVLAAASTRQANLTARAA
jgi:signal transduction histidine kinase/ActR/RegA family two-component response regulator